MLITSDVLGWVFVCAILSVLCRFANKVLTRNSCQLYACHCCDLGVLVSVISTIGLYSYERVPLHGRASQSRLTDPVPIKGSLVPAGSDGEPALYNGVIQVWRS